MKIDWWLGLPIILLTVLSLVILRSVVPVLWPYQAVFALTALIFFLIFSNLDCRILVSFYWFIYLGSLIFLVSPFFLGSHSRGALRWLQFGQVYVQPSEIIKPFLLLVFCVLATSTIKYKWLVLGLVFLLPATIIFMQPDLGSALVLAAGWFVIFIKIFPHRVFLFLLLLLLPCSWFVLRDYQKDRILVFFNPYRDPLGRGYHVIQSTIAVGSGQWFGRGLGQGTQSQLRFLPERHTDFIFASLAEELGFVGSVLALGLLAVILGRIYVLLHKIDDPVGRLYGQAVLGMLGFQIFVNIGMNIGLAPVTGITLPFLSYGGSSLLSLAIILGLVTSVSVRVRSLSSFQIH